MSFRVKVFTALVLVVLGITGAVLLATQRVVESTYLGFFNEQVNQTRAQFKRLQEARLAAVQQRCENLSRGVRLRQILNRLQEAIESKDADDARHSRFILYQTAEDELRDWLAEVNPENETVRATFFRFLDVNGRIIPPAPGVDAGYTRGEGKDLLHARLQKAVKETKSSRFAAMISLQRRDGRVEVVEALFNEIVDRISHERLGWLLIAFPVPQDSGVNAQMTMAYLTPEGIGEHSGSLDFWKPAAAKLESVPDATGSIRELEWADSRLLAERLPSVDQPIWRVFAYSMRDSHIKQGTLRATVVMLGVAGLAVAMVLGLFVAHGLSDPIRALAEGTRKVSKGDFTATVEVTSRDELGELAGAFNQMTKGLAEREKYRTVLNMVADKAVAEELMSSNLDRLGGETRQVTVIFCDIRGFTALTEKMDPQEVIAMLNEHMTLLTGVVYAHHGVVDKFVGDLIMALFGAPKAYGNDAANAAACALEMVAARRRLNETSKYKIEVGIGISTGEVVAGCMGSADRLSYTVLGERVNLAARFCSKAARMDVVVDDVTARAAEQFAMAEPLEPMALKGFSAPVPAFRLVRKEIAG